MLDPKVIIDAQIQKNFPKFGGLRKLCNYKESGASVSDPATGASVPLYISEQDIYIIFDEFRMSMSFAPDKLADGSAVRMVDKVAIFPSLDLSIIPKVTDVIVDPGGTEWRVLGKAEDPSPGHYELHVRPLSEA